jgi:hypothetical protein
MRSAGRDALVDFLLLAIAEEGAAAFPGHVIASLRQVVPCEAVSYHEWSPQGLGGGSLAADEPDAWLRVWRGYRHVMHGDPIAGYPGSARDRAPLPDCEWSGRAMAISDFVSNREFRRRRLYAEICKPLDVRAVMKVFLPTEGATGAAFVFKTSRKRFTDADRSTL